jgi:DNA replication protein
MTGAETKIQPATFAGFPAGARATAVPSMFFSHLLPQIEDADELRATLYVIYALARRRGYPRFISGRELAAEAPLLAALGDEGDPEATLRLERALAAAVERHTLLAVAVEQDNRRDVLYLLNTPSSRRAFGLIEAGRLDLGRRLPASSLPPASERANVYQLYEENIGPLTPLVAQDLKEAESLYPFEWIEEAFREAAALNKRSWRYSSRILERWATEGRKREETGPDPGAGESARAQIIRRYQEAARGLSR